MKYTRLLLSIVYLMLMSTIYAFAQQYPVQVITQLLPPYTLNVPAWYNGANEKLVVLLTNQDMNRLTQVRLRLRIEGSGVRITSRQGAFSPIINLDSGVPTRLSLNDLAPYFKPENLNFESGISYANYVKTYTLPEGFYFICFEAVEVFSGQVVGVQCGQAYLSLNDPPFLNMPRKGESILHRDPTNIIFQWTPRHMSDPYLAFNTEYEFTMVELLDNGMVPDAAFAINRPAFHQERSSTSTFLYGPSHPLLTPGRRYAWRICVKSNDGSNLSSFKNQGCSEVYWFTYQNDCLPPINIQAEAMSVAARITWTPVMASQNGIGLGGTYKVDYRAYKMSPADWQSTTSSTNRVTLDKLDPDRSYEYRVGRSCDDNLTYVYSDIKRFKTNVEVTRGDCTAGAEPAPITNREPIQTLHAGDVITAGGGSPIRITQVSGQGEFTGHGYGTISLLGHAQFKVKFANIVVNTDKQLIGGFIESTYDKDEKQIADLDQIFSDISTLTDELASLMTKLDTPITSKAAQEKIEKEIESVNERMDPLFSSIETLLEKRTDLSEEQKETYRARNKELRSSTLIAQNGDNDWQKKSREQLGKKYDALTEIRNELKAMPSGKGETASKAGNSGVAAKGEQAKDIASLKDKISFCETDPKYYKGLYDGAIDGGKEALNLLTLDGLTDFAKGVGTLVWNYNPLNWSADATSFREKMLTQLTSSLKKMVITDDCYESGKLWGHTIIGIFGAEGLVAVGKGAIKLGELASVSSNRIAKISKLSEEGALAKVGGKVSKLNHIDDFWARIPQQVRIDEIREAFTTKTIQLKHANQDMYVFRHCNEGAPQLSNWYTDEILSPTNARVKLALPDGNKALRLIKVKIPKGTPYIEGTVASQIHNLKSNIFGPHALGGGKQFYFLDDHKSVIHVVDDIPNPKK